MFCLHHVWRLNIDCNYLQPSTLEVSVKSYRNTASLQKNVEPSTIEMNFNQWQRCDTQKASQTPMAK